MRVVLSIFVAAIIIVPIYISFWSLKVDNSSDIEECKKILLNHPSVFDIVGQVETVSLSIKSLQYANENLYVFNVKGYKATERFEVEYKAGRMAMIKIRTGFVERTEIYPRQGNVKMLFPPNIYDAVIMFIFSVIAFCISKSVYKGGRLYKMFYPIRIGKDNRVSYIEFMTGGIVMMVLCICCLFDFIEIL